MGREQFNRRFMDPVRREWVDEQLPTYSVKLKGPARRTEARSPKGTIPGSFYVTGTHYDFALGTYSLRITRMNVGVSGGVPASTQKGTLNKFGAGTHYRWYIRHSRDGTLDVLTFDEPGQVIRDGNPMSPIYSMGPGSLIYGFLGDHLGQVGTRVSFHQSLEGFVG